MASCTLGSRLPLEDALRRRFFLGTVVVPWSSCEVCTTALDAAALPVPLVLSVFSDDSRCASCSLADMASYMDEAGEWMNARVVPIEAHGLTRGVSVLIL